VALIATPFLLLIPALSSTKGRRLQTLAVYVLGCAATFSPWLIRNLVQTGNPVFPLVNSVFGARPEGWGAEEDLRWQRGHSASASEREFAAQAGLLWVRTLGDPLQRIGPAVVLLAVLGLTVKGASRWDWALLGVLVLQVFVWALATHLFARFALPMLLPLCALAVRGFARIGAARSRWIVGAIVVVGVGWNLTFAARLSWAEAPVAAPSSLFTTGAWTGYEYLGVINRELPSESKLLLVGESRPYYMDRPLDYGVVFNKNPFAEMIAARNGPAEVVGWLRSRGYTHVLVNWSEVSRLSRTYGFPPEIQPALFDELARYGLTLFRSFQLPSHSGRYVDLYAVSPP
jgi:hypothetical protein